MTLRWIRHILRPRRLAGLAVAIALVCGYLMYLTPQKRAVRYRLSEADTKSKAVIDVRMKPLNDLFA